MQQEKQTIEIDLNDVRKATREFLTQKTLNILEAAVNLPQLKTDAESALKSGVFRTPKIVEAISEQCEWAFANMVKQALENSDLKSHVDKLTKELLADDDFNAQLKEQIKAGILKRV